MKIKIKKSVLKQAVKNILKQGLHIKPGMTALQIYDSQKKRKEEDIRLLKKQRLNASPRETFYNQLQNHIARYDSNTLKTLIKDQRVWEKWLEQIRKQGYNSSVKKWEELTPRLLKQYKDKEQQDKKYRQERIKRQQQEKGKPKLKDLGWANGWTSTPQVVKKCHEQKHDIKTKTQGGVTTTYCPIDNYMYKTDSSD